MKDGNPRIEVKRLGAQSQNLSLVRAVISIEAANLIFQKPTPRLPPPTGAPLNTMEHIGSHEHKRCLAMTILAVDAKVTGENHQSQINAWAREGLPQEHQQILSKIERILAPAEREELEAGRVAEAFARHKFDPKQQMDLAAHYLTARMALGADLSISLESVSEQQDRLQKAQEATERQKALQEVQKARPRERDDGWDL